MLNIVNNSILTVQDSRILIVSIQNEVHFLTSPVA